MRHSVERALKELDHAKASPALLSLFEELCRSGLGFAAMDFGYAFDSLVWDANLHTLGPDSSERVAAVIADAIRADIVPTRYYTDAEILVDLPEEQDFAIFGGYIDQKNLLSRVGSLLQDFNVSMQTPSL